MKVTKSTIIRTIMLIMVIVNIVLERCGIDVIPTDEYTITMIVETLIELAIIVVAWWKNNSYTQNAIKADEFLKSLNAGETAEETIAE